jgi:TPP-dependent pyruvate/acetoin dehydrogenase alpha subunit
VAQWWAERDPVTLIRERLRATGALDAAADAALTAALTAELELAIAAAEQAPPPDPASLFEDVYETPPAHLVEQAAGVSSPRELA